MGFGEHIKEWRNHRRISQLELATNAGISTRHLSFLETGRSRPSEGMILRLSSVLDIPARDQGVLFAAAGFRPRFATSPAASHSAFPPAISEAIGLMLARHDPYPGVVFDHQYNVLKANQAFLDIAGMAGVTMSPGDNFLEAYLGATPLRSVIVNWAHSAADLIYRIRAEARLQGPRSPLLDRIERLAGGAEIQAALAAFPETDRLPILPIQMRIGAKRFNWITTLTTFGSAQDALLQGILIESFFPADAETQAHFQD